MKGGSSDQIEEKPDIGNVEASEISTNEKANSVPWHIGETKNAAIWLSNPFAQFTKDAPSGPKK